MGLGTQKWRQQLFARIGCPECFKNARNKWHKYRKKHMAMKWKFFHTATTQLAFIFIDTRALLSHPLETVQVFCAPHIWLHIWLQQLVWKQSDMARQLGAQHDWQRRTKIFWHPSRNGHDRIEDTCSNSKKYIPIAAHYCMISWMSRFESNGCQMAVGKCSKDFSSPIWFDPSFVIALEIIVGDSTLAAHMAKFPTNVN